MWNTLQVMMLAMKETLILIVDGVDELLERKREQILDCKVGFGEVHRGLSTFCLTYLFFNEFSAGPLKIQLNDMLQAEFLLECKEDFKDYTGEFRGGVFFLNMLVFTGPITEVLAGVITRGSGDPRILDGRDRNGHVKQ